MLQGAEGRIAILNPGPAGAVWDYNTTLAGPNNGADGHMPSAMMLPTKGIWRLDAYLDNKLFGAVTVEVQ